LPEERKTFSCLLHILTSLQYPSVGYRHAAGCNIESVVSSQLSLISYGHTPVSLSLYPDT